MKFLCCPSQVVFDIDYPFLHLQVLMISIKLKKKKYKKEKKNEPNNYRDYDTLAMFESVYATLYAIAYSYQDNYVD